MLKFQGINAWWKQKGHTYLTNLQLLAADLFKCV